MSDLLTFQAALDKSAGGKRNLLLGNGFSIACRPKIFTYGSLFDNADFSKNPELVEVFKALNTTDFEVAIRSLEASSRLAPIYATNGVDAKAAMAASALALREILIKTVTLNHPDSPYSLEEDEFLHCRMFLANFISPQNYGRIFTLNYDLLLYWTLMHREFDDGSVVDLSTYDGFGDDDPNVKEDYVTWQGEGTRNRSTIYFLHGALHLFDAGKELQKFTWIRKGEKLKDQSWEAIRNNKLPLFVAEGETSQKLGRIMHNAYLFQALKMFRATMDTRSGSLFIHGHSLAENDDHILKEISRGKCRQVFIGLHGDMATTGNQEIIKRARLIQSLRATGDLEVNFYGSETAKVWG